MRILRLIRLVVFHFYNLIIITSFAAGQHPARAERVELSTKASDVRIFEKVLVSDIAYEKQPVFLPSISHAPLLAKIIFIGIYGVIAYGLIGYGSYYRKRFGTVSSIMVATGSLMIVGVVVFVLFTI